MARKRLNVFPIRIMREVPFRILRKFLVGACWGNARAIRLFQKRKKSGVAYPPLVFISVTQRCNLICKGCWATGVKQAVDMTPELLHAIVTESRAQGCRFFGILGGEPLLLPWLLDFFDAHPEAYFQLFTNGYFLDEVVAQRLARAGNVSPLISIEGGEGSYVIRRGEPAAYTKALAALAACRKHGLITGVATSVSVATYAEVVSADFVDEMVERGAHYLWYYIYRPSGPEPGFEQALDDRQVQALRQFLLVQRKCRHDVVIVDAYWDAQGMALCPAATGISHHINARGEVEPCPPIQCSDCQIKVGGVVQAMTHSAFLEAFRTRVPGLTRGCVLMDHPRELAVLARQYQAHDSSGRDSFFEELAARRVMGCHNHDGEPMPESSWAYRFAKRHWFFGFGAYG